MTAENYKFRMDRVRENMHGKADVFFLGPSSDFFYLCGYGNKADERLLLLVLPLDEPPFIIANLLYKEQLISLPSSGLFDEFIFWKDGEDPFIVLKAAMDKRKIPIKRIAAESRLPALFTIPLAKTFPSSEFILGNMLTEPLRQYKDEAELQLIRNACRQSDAALTVLMGEGEGALATPLGVGKAANDGKASRWLGKSEAEFFATLSGEFYNRGLKNFGAGIAVGANAAMPHHGSGKDKIESGKCLLVDFWGSLDSYFTDCTRTFHFGKPEKEFEKIHAIVLEAQEAAQAAVLPGKTLSDVDYAARSIIEKAGYGEFFTHRTGHGCGIDVHEGDSVNAGVNVLLERGMVFSIEPGIYLPGRFGVRIENLVAVTESGCEILHSFPKDLMVIGNLW